MAYIMDMASGTTHPAEEAPIKYHSRIEPQDAAALEEYPQLQLAMVETRTQNSGQTLPPAAIEALIKTLED